MARRDVPSLRRRKSKREPQRRFTIICEGQYTEPDYFRALQATIRDARIDLDIVPAAGDPLAIARRAVERAAEARASRRRRGKTDSYEESDEIWAVFDRDAHERFDAAITLCRAKRIAVARSNPCFEVWLILHHQDFHRSEHRHAIQAHLATLDPQYDAKRGKRADCARFMASMEKAEHRAASQLAARQAEGIPFGPPSTTVFHLTKAIRTAAALMRGLPPPED